MRKIETEEVEVLQDIIDYIVAREKESQSFIDGAANFSIASRFIAAKATMIVIRKFIEEYQKRVKEQVEK